MAAQRNPGAALSAPRSKLSCYQKLQRLCCLPFVEVEDGEVLRQQSEKKVRPFVITATAGRLSCLSN